MFELDARLQADTVALGDLPLCRLLLMNDRTYPWFILVPRRECLRELHHLDEGDRRRLWAESAALSVWMEAFFGCEKLNVAALGNIVSQLHLHHVGRTRTDPAWPGPVWGTGPAVNYAGPRIEELAQAVVRALPELRPVQPAAL